MHLLQACARVYGEREVLGACVRAMNQVTLHTVERQLTCFQRLIPDATVHLAASYASVWSQDIIKCLSSDGHASILLKAPLHA